ncbi:hypothetical protein Sjap_004698 [Stephania japonica]|uniref:Alpha-1,3-glucosyltransferase n=1 Tax=Stephania japonica TaxID=461633 RepID=A0AAP0K514_9MAGN
MEPQIKQQEEEEEEEGEERSNPQNLLWVFTLSTTLKLLLIPSYHSTDFEVHRHWLALTSSLPLHQWYTDTTSQWTLDYPPLFAYFERLLALLAPLFDPRIAHLRHGLHYAAHAAVLFQRLSVIASDLCLLYGCHVLGKNVGPWRRADFMWALLLLSPALLLVDHVHFQYNGFLIGWLLVSLSAVEEGRDLVGGFVFAVLLCFKHLFAVAAPVYFVYFLRHYCWRKGGGGGGVIGGFGRLLKMGFVVGVVFGVAFGPFFYHGQLIWDVRLCCCCCCSSPSEADFTISQAYFICVLSIRLELVPRASLMRAVQIKAVLSRMFPFGRGLCHAYWAPNFWVFYIILDKVLAVLLTKLGFSIPASSASFTGGLVGESSSFAVLPKITPLVTFLLVLFAMSPCLIKIWREPRPRLITRWVAYAYTCGFLFGWHVHEKASLHFVIPLAIVATESLADARHYFLLSIVSCYSLFPLLFEAKEYPIKVLLLLLYSLLMWSGFTQLRKFQTSTSSVKKGDKERSRKGTGGTKEEGGGTLIGWVGMSYLLGLLVVEIWGQFLQPYLLGDRFPFLPLMLISVYCAVGIMYSWLWQLRWILKCP